MEEKHVAFESIPGEDQEIDVNNLNNSTGNYDHGWQKVTNAKRQRKTKPLAVAASNSLANGSSKIAANGSLAGGDNVFRSLEQQSEDRRRQILEAQRVANGIASDNAPAKVGTPNSDNGLGIINLVH